MKTSSVRIICAAVVLLSLCACQQQGIYYWGDYSQTYYNYMKSPSDETLAAHLTSLDKIIKESEKINKPVPPGVYGEYGYYMLMAGKKDKAIDMFEQEKSLYPESRVLMDRLIVSARDDADTQGQEAKITNADMAKTDGDVNAAQPTSTTN